MIEGIRWMRESSGNLILYIKEDNVFVRYNKSIIAQPDHIITNGSPGYATAQYAIKKGYKYV